jgi:hypothetical protein
MDTPVDDFEAKRLVGVLRIQMVDPRIRRHFFATPVTSPVLSGGHERPSNTLAAEGRLNVPAFDEADGVGRIAAVGVRSQACENESNCATAWVLGNKKHCRQRSWGVASEYQSHVASVFFRSRIGPQLMAHSRQSGEVGSRCRPHNDHRGLFHTTR